MSSDGILVKEYAQSGSEAAFAKLVRRYLDFVYSTALRGVGGDEHLAKDVSQSVFMDLAKKADRLRNKSVLTGWLYAATCFAAAKAVRSERRRKTREHEAQSMKDVMTEPPRDPDWEQIGPVINTVMLELKESDREVLLLRFFERRSLAAVGAELGLRENAARMRVERALERLRDRLVRRGINSTASSLALVLAHQTLTPAPIGLAASVTAASLAGAATSSGLSILNLVLMSNAKTVIIGAIIATGALTPIVVQYDANNRLKSEVKSLQSQLAAPPSPQPVSTDPAELEGLRREREELMRLRGEVSALRQQASNDPKAQGNVVKNEHAESKADSSSEAEDARFEAENARDLLAKSPEIPMIPAKLWVNAGVATPSAACQTMNWATANRDTNALLQTLSLGPKAREIADEIFAGLPESIRQRYGTVDGLLVAWRLNVVPTAYRVLSQTDQGPDDATLVIQFQNAEGHVRENPIQFYRDETGGWRAVTPAEVMQKLEHVANSLSEQPSASGK